MKIIRYKKKRLLFETEKLFLFEEKYSTMLSLNKTEVVDLQMYSNGRLFEIAKDNYLLLTKYCSTLQKEGYWEKPESILKKTIFDVLDMYVQSVLLSLALYCNRLNETEKEFIISIPNDNILELSEDCILEEAILQAKKIANAPPIILQLCGLRDAEKNTNITSIFFEALLNILLAMSYINNAKDIMTNGYIQKFFKDISAFLNSTNANGVKIDEKYIFRKICDDQLELNSELLIARTSGGNMEDVVEKYILNKEKIKIQVPKIDALKRKNKDDKNMIPLEEEKPEELSDTLVWSAKTALEELLEELDGLVGLADVKEEISSLINLIKVKKMRESYQMPQMEMSFHMVFTGNPGTGKTTVARLVAKIYKELGLLSEGTLIETDRSGLVAGYVGQTALKVKEVVEKAIGGVLFIDEAYSLSNGIGTNDFGGEAIDTLVKMMEDNRDNLVVIVAGYNKEMKTFLKSNTGLVSRFNKFIVFSDYTPNELIEILIAMAEKSGMHLSTQAIEYIKGKIKAMTKPKMRIFGNARGIRNVFEKIVVKQANRIVTMKEPNEEMLTEILEEDVVNVL